ncbi:hypothetical protein AgCh_029023 [Apium graveolens]
MPFDSLGLAELKISQERFEPFIEEAPTLELNRLPDHLSYSFLGAPHDKGLGYIFDDVENGWTDIPVPTEDRGPHVPMRAATDNEPSVPKPRHEWSDPDIEQVRKDKNAMNILFNRVDGDMVDNIINCKTSKDVWTLSRLFVMILKQDDRMEKGGSIVLVAELEKEKDMKVEAVKSTSKVWESEGKGLVAENEDHLSQDDMDDIDEHLAFLSRRFAKLKFKKNFGAAKPSKNMEFLEDGVYVPNEVKFKEAEGVKPDCVTVQKKFSRDRVVRAYEVKERVSGLNLEDWDRVVAVLCWKRVAV